VPRQGYPADQVEQGAEDGEDEANRPALRQRCFFSPIRMALMPRYPSMKAGEAMSGPALEGRAASQAPTLPPILRAP